MSTESGPARACTVEAATTERHKLGETMNRIRVNQCGMLLWSLLLVAGIASAGQRRAEPPAPSPMDSMTIEEIRAYQSYFYAAGGRDPLTMRFPTDRELGAARKSGPLKAPTVEEQEAMLTAWLEDITAAIKDQDYEKAIETATAAIEVVDNEWPPIKPEYTRLIRMNEEIRGFQRMATRLKNQQDITREFVSLHLRVDGVVWSPTDARAVVNGKTLSAGEILLSERPLGDLRVETIEEHGVVFQFRGLRYRLPVEIHAPPGASELEGVPVEPLPPS
ncbi:MAG: general secretion pathway protein GspB [Planctomycetaceae bacterium]|nr:general secretion pathway protein GspB [Planctomycetaceae bacterium]